MRPELLLLDEPMSNLDAKLREEMHIELRAIQKRLGITTILVRHDQVEAITMSDRIAHAVRCLRAPRHAVCIDISQPHEHAARGSAQAQSALLGSRRRGHDATCAARRPRRAGRGARVHPSGENASDERRRSYARTHRDPRVHRNQWLLEVDTEFGKLHIAQPNYGAPPPEEGREPTRSKTTPEY